MPTENSSGAPLATAAHAHARTARLFGRLKRSWLMRITLACGALALITGAPALFAAAPLPWFGVFRVAFTLAAFVLLVRVVYLLTAETLWLLRNRLILAYVFMGVVPVVLIAAMLAIGAYMAYGQYAAFLLLSDINDRTHNVGAVNTLTVEELARHPNRASEGPGLSNYYASYYFPRGYGGVHSYFFAPDGAGENRASQNFGRPQPWMKNGFLGLISYRGGYAIAGYRSSARPASPGERVLTLYRIDTHNLNSLAQPVGQITLGWSGFVDLSNTGAVAPRLPAAPRLSSTGRLRPAHSLFDIRITSWAFLPVTDWATGQQHTVLATIDTRPSLLNDVLFASLPSENSQLAARWPLFLLAAIAVGFLIIEAFSLVAGIRLTRTITGAVNDLYIGTEYVNRGDFGHRIPVRTRDQLAALEIAFNNMIDSIGRLLKEQRQKQRLESELNIAHEVQAQLFPRTPPRVAGIEILGRCLPARVVSGDYYDFLQLSPAQISLALGDISGKGISAALLMATIVAALRAYYPSFADVAVGATAGHGGSLEGGHPPPDPAASAANPAAMLQRLNRQIYHSTPPEKYATMFLAIYDASRRELRYTNAGHLPPVVLSAGGVRRLERGGMVVGLFEDVSFELGTVVLEPGDVLAAWSDGITEAENEYGVEFGEARLLEMLEQGRGQPLRDTMTAVLNAVGDWVGSHEQADDITLLMARVE